MKEDLDCKKQTRKLAEIEFSDTNPIPIQVLIEICSKFQKRATHGYKIRIGWNKGQRAIAASSEHLLKILKGKNNIFTTHDLSSVINGRIAHKTLQ